MTMKTIKLKKKKKQSYVVTYLYVSPEGTYTKEEGVRTIVLTKVCSSLIGAIKFVGDDNFDGKETFEEHFKPEIKEHFKNSPKAQYFGDDYSAGQWFSIAPIINGRSVELNMEEYHQE